MFQITFRFESGEDKSIFAALDEQILDVARKANVAIDAPCSGNVSCGKCKVRLLEGEVRSEITRHLTQEEYDDGYRLACNSFVIANATLLVPDIAAAYKSRMKVADLSSYEEVRIFNDIKKNVANAGIVFENDLSVIELQMHEPTLDDTMPDNERLIRALKAATGINELIVPFAVLKKLPDVLRDNDFTVQLIIKTGKHQVYVMDILGKKDDDRIYGVAIDIGTTTVSALLIDMKDGHIFAKASSGNGQIRFGADVINRIVESTKPDGIKKLQDAVIKETINPIIESMCKTAKLDPNQIHRMCIAANTTMNHLFLGLNANYLRMEPFIPVFFEVRDIKAIDLNLTAHPDADIMIAPNIGSYVGGDITAGTLASMIWNKEEYALFVDLGTNGELVFGNKDFLMSCSCSAGPAFEGGDISCGMRATDGAIESIVIDRDTMEPTYSVIGGGNPVGLCGSGIIDIISELYTCGIINSKGKFAREGKRVRTDQYNISSYIIATKEEAHSVRDIELTEVDIDNFIRAKGAIFSAVKVMLQSLEMDVDVIESVYVAGGIGSGINMRNAVNIGMLPDIDISKYHYIGNSALSGAYCMLISSEAKAKVDELGKSMTYLELSTNNHYMEEFVAACFIPHTDADLFPSVKLK